MESKSISLQVLWRNGKFKGGGLTGYPRGLRAVFLTREGRDQAGGIMMHGGSFTLIAQKTLGGGGDGKIK